MACSLSALHCSFKREVHLEVFVGKCERGNNTTYILQMQKLKNRFAKVLRKDSPGVKCPDAHKNFALSDLPKVTGEVCGRAGI